MSDSAAPPPTKWPWSVLGLDKMPPELADVRRAYARALKKIDQSTDIEGFAKLRQAYEEALALKESRAARAQAAKARKAAAADKAARVKTPEAAPTEPLPPESLPPKPTADELQQAALAAAAEAEYAAFAESLQRLAGPNLLQSPEAQIFALLDSPHMAQPMRKAVIGHAISRLIAAGYRLQFDGNQSLDRSFSQRLFQRLDAEYGWISDYAAFRDAFGTATDLQHEILERFHDGNLPVALPPPRRKGPFGKTADLIADNPNKVTLLLVFLLMVASGWSSAAPKNPMADLLFKSVLALGAFLILMVPARAFWNLFQLRYHTLTVGLLASLGALTLALMLPIYGAYQAHAIRAGVSLFMIVVITLCWIGPSGSAAFEGKLLALWQRLFPRRKG